MNSINKIFSLTLIFIILIGIVITYYKLYIKKKGN